MSAGYASSWVIGAVSGIDNWRHQTRFRRTFGEGGIDRRGENIYRLRYRVGGKRFTKTFHGTLTQARVELRALIRASDIGEHVEPKRLTVAQWIDQWLVAGAPGRRKKKVGQRTLERYEQLLNTHVKPAIGEQILQQLRAAAIDNLYALLEDKIAPRTAHHVHIVLGAALATAHRTRLIAINPMAHVQQVPNPEAMIQEDDDRGDIADGLEEHELSALVAGFKHLDLFPIVALAAACGARRNELLALRWTDLDLEKKKLRIERALEQTKKFGIRVKAPKTKRGCRTIDLDDATIGMLVAKRAEYQRLISGIPDGADVDLTLVRLPAKALIFPAVPGRGESFDLTRPRNPRNFSKEFARRADVVGFGATRFHDLRGVHATALLDAGIPVHRVAERIGDDPAVLLRNYAKRKRSKGADESLAQTLAAIAGGFLNF
ncbi:site-specific integrase [Bradyrhizobium tropiciagri]|uniref:tyrosine-type recombinase/integrase n=1 Tax=Bradyrhizobium tropiciagri TaxID=312253 RepID=UPI001BAA6C1A|nr:site-specific integrase [Bradyrhizobium tropiciagri]MBR0871396.1 site-specific integrase [Bradyrhizobium tropiciagri]